MDFTPTEAQTDLRDLTRRLLADFAVTDAGFDRALWQRLAEAGVLSAALPESVGGSGFGVLEQGTILAELGRAVAPVPYLESIAVAATALATFGTPSQREAWAAPAALGTVVLTAAVDREPVQATPDHHLTGVKTTVPWAPEADAILVTAGQHVYLVAPDAAGVTIEPQETVDLTSAGRLTLDNAAAELVPDLTATWLLEAATLGRCATQFGVTERALELTAEHARTRIQFDRPIGTFQAVAQRLADGYINLQAIRLTLTQAAWRRSEDLDCAAELATAKFWAAEGGHRIAHTAVHVHGGMGIDVSHPLHRYFLAAKHHEFALGGATPQLRHLGAILAEEPA